MGGKLHLVRDVPKLTLVRGDLDVHTYLKHQHAQVRSAASKVVSLRERLRGLRPTMRLYKAASGDRAPLGPAFQLVEDMCVQRDQAPAEQLVAYDTAIMWIAVTLLDYVDDAISASNQRRAMAKRNADGAA